MCSQKPMLSKEDLAFRKLLREVKELTGPIDDLLSNDVYVRRSRKTCIILTRNEENAADLKQEVDLKVAQKLVAKFTPDYERPFGKFFAWFRKTARNTYYDRFPSSRATKEQTMQAQKVLKDCGFYAGRQTGKLDEDTLAGLRKYQLAKNLKVTRRLNKVTLEMMGIDLAEQRAKKPIFVDTEELFQIEDRSADPEVLMMRCEIFDHVARLPRKRRIGVTLYLKGYSLREVEEEMGKLGLNFSHITIGRWVRDALAPFFSDTKVLFDWKVAHPRPAATRKAQRKGQPSGEKLAEI